MEPAFEEDDSDIINGFSWKAVLMGYGYGITLGFVVGNVMLVIGKPMWFIKNVVREIRRLRGRRMIEIRDT